MEALLSASLQLGVKKHNHPALWGCVSLPLVCVVAHMTTRPVVLTQRKRHTRDTPATALPRPRCPGCGWHQRCTAGILLKSHLDLHSLLMFPELAEARAITFPSFSIGSPIQHLSPPLTPQGRHLDRKAIQLTGMSLSLLLLECKSPANKVFLDALDGNRGERENTGMGGWEREQRNKKIIWRCRTNQISDISPCA